jgi:NAD+ diphosphatase
VGVWKNGSSCLSTHQTFTGNPLDRAAAERRDPDWVKHRLADPASRYLFFHDLRPLLERNEGSLRIAWQAGKSGGSIPAAADRHSAVLLGVDRSGIAHFAVPFRPGNGSRPGTESAAFTDTRAAAASLPAGESAIVAQARSLLSWHRDHPICSRCGSSTEPVEAGYARRCTRNGCGASHFPRTDPVVIMMVVRGESALFGRSVRVPPFPPGLFSCLAGYIEPGESVEEAVRREVLEEAGIEIGRVVYHSSQPWPFPSSLMIGCFGEALTESVHADPAEVEEVRWFGRDEVKAALARWPEITGIRLPAPLTAAHRLARAWLDAEPGTYFSSGSGR